MWSAFVGNRFTSRMDNGTRLACLNDELDAVARLLDPVSLARFSQACKSFHAVATSITRGIKLAFLPPTCNQGQLVDLMGISPEEARRLPHSVVTQRFGCRRGYYDTHVFSMQEALPALLDHLAAQSGRSGWEVLAERLQLVQAKRERREDLDVRRHEKMQQRRAALEAWFEQRPFGPDTASVDAWLVSVKDREGGDPLNVSTIRKFLTASALTAPKLGNVKDAITEIESRVAHDAAQRALVAEKVVKAGFSQEEAAELTTADRVRHFFTKANADVTAVAAMVVDAERERLRQAQRRAEAEAAAAKVRLERDARRKVLQKAIRKRKLTRESDPKTYDTFVSCGKTANGIEDANEVAEFIAGRAKRKREFDEILTTSELQTIGQNYAFMYERDGTFKGRMATLSDISTELGHMLQEQRVRVQEQASRERSLLNALDARGINRHTWRREAEQFKMFGVFQGKTRSAHDVADMMATMGRPNAAADRRCSVAGCSNLHRVHNPTAGPDGPVCGACESKL